MTFENCSSRWKYERARKSADTRILRKANVIGTAFGSKYVDGQPTNQKCFTLFVRNKLPFSSLESQDIIPSSVVRDGHEWPTDVVELKCFVDESSIATRDPVGQLGTCDLIASQPQGYVAVTCAHAVAGLDDRAFNDRETIMGASPAQGVFNLGETIDGDLYSGSGYHPDYGKFDAALVEITAPELLLKIPLLREIQIYRPISPDSDWRADLEGLPVVGYGAVSGRVTSTIRYVRTRFYENYTDFVVGDGSQLLTTSGDSGMCWWSQDGRLIGIHFAGERHSGSSYSVRSASMLAFRIADRFGLSEFKRVNELDP